MVAECPYLIPESFILVFICPSFEEANGHILQKSLSACHISITSSSRSPFLQWKWPSAGLVYSIHKILLVVFLSAPCGFLASYTILTKWTLDQLIVFHSSFHSLIFSHCCLKSVFRKIPCQISGYSLQHNAAKFLQTWPASFLYKIPNFNPLGSLAISLFPALWLYMQ